MVTLIRILKINAEVGSQNSLKKLAYDVSDHFPPLCEIDIPNIFTHLPADYSRNIPILKWADTNT